MLSNHDPRTANGAAPAAPIRVAIIEDLSEVRECLKVLIDGTAGFRCTGDFPSMETALGAIKSCRPDLILVDLGLPGMSGAEGIQRLRDEQPGIPTVVLTIYEDDTRIFDALCAGACGYLLKTTPPARLLEALREAVGGGAPMTPAVARRVIQLFQDLKPPATADYGLTPHEVRLLKLLVDGHNYTTAAAELGVTAHTVSFHLRSVYAKLHVHSKTEAVAKALRHRLIK
jgi:DNA-binding NarL/FixJ family response regulator